MNCINRQSKEFINLLEKTGLQPSVLEAKIIVYQNKNGIESWPTSDYFNIGSKINFALKSIDILDSDKAKQVFDKGKKNGWDLNKILTELQIPKEQRQLILDLDITDREQIALELASNYSYTVEINTAKEKAGTTTKINFEENPFLDEEDYQTDGGGNTKYYSNLSAPGGIGRNKYEGNPDWEYQELEFKTPLIIPSIKGHAKFATDNGIGWARVWYNKKTGVVEIQEIQSDLFQKGRDKEQLVGVIKNENKLLENEQLLKRFGATNKDLEKAKEKVNNELKQNQFLQLLNKDSNWVTFFIKSIIQDSAKKGYEKVLFPTGNTAGQVENFIQKIPKYDYQKIQSLEKSIENAKKEPFKKSIQTRSFEEGNKKVIVLNFKDGSEVIIRGTSKEDAEKNFENNINKYLEKNNDIINKFENELNRLKTVVNTPGYNSYEFSIIEGIEQEKARSVVGFYENTVANILKKTYGKDNVKLITDEYGNTWNEITITNKSKDVIFFQQLDLFKSNNVLTIDQRDYVKDYIEKINSKDSKSGYKNVLKWNEKYNSFDVKDKLDTDARKLNKILQDKLGINFLPLKIEPKKIVNFTKGNATYGGKRTELFVAKLMAIDGTFPQIDTVRELRLPNPKLTDQMKGIMNDLGISLVNWEQYSDWYEKKYGKPVHANAIADMTNKVISMRTNGEKLDTLPEEVSHFILYAMKDIPWVKGLINRVEETPEWLEHSAAYTRYYNGDMDLVRLEVLGKILAKGLINEGQSLTPKWRRYIMELWDRFLALFNSDSIRRRMEYLAAEVIYEPSVRKNIAVNLNRFGISPYDNAVFANLDVEEFTGSDILEQHSAIVKKAVTALEGSLKRNMNSKAGAVDSRMRLYNFMKDQINKGNHTIAMANLVSVVEKESVSIKRRVMRFNEDFKKENSDANFHTFSRILRMTNDFGLTYKDTFTELESELMVDESKLSAQIEVFDERDDLDADEKLIAKNLKERLVLVNSMLESIGNTKKVMTLMEENYQKYAKNIFMNVITPVLEEKFAKENTTEEDKKIYIDNLRTQLDEAKDIGSINKALQSMAESGDSILGIADRLVKDNLEKARVKALSLQKDIIDLATEYETATGSRDTSFMYGRNGNGDLTGDFLTEIDEARFKENKKAFFDELNNRYEKLLKEATSEDAIDTINDKKGKEIVLWMKANTEVLNESMRDHLKKRKKDSIYAYYITDPDSVDQKVVAEKKYQDWLRERELKDLDTGYVKYKKEFIVPKRSVYASQQYKDLTPEQKKFHTAYMKMYKESKEHMPDHIYYSNVAIQIRKDGMERILSSENKFSEFNKMVSEGFTRKVDDTDRGMTDQDLSTEEQLHRKLLTDSSGRRIWTVPIHHLMRLEDTSELSTDAVSAMSAFIDTATRYESISEITDSLEVFGDILKERKMLNTDMLGRTSVVTEGGNAYDRYMKYMEMVIYGRRKRDEGIIPGTNIDVAKLVDNLNSYTALNNLAFNLYAAVANVGLGNILMREEAFAKQYVTHEDINFAFKEYSKQLPGILGEVGEQRSKNKLRLLLEYTDALQDHEGKMKTLDWQKEKYQRLMNRSHLFFLNHAGEHQMQSRMMLALMNNTKLKDSEGKDITLYDAFEVANNRVVLKENIFNPDGSKFSEKQMIPFNIRMKAINQSLHGIYNETDKSAIQQYSLGRAAVMFRKWLVPGLNRRFEKEYYNWSDMETREGFHRTSGKFLIGVIKEAKDTKNLLLAAKNNWNNLTDAQKANMARSIAEVGYFFVLLGAGTAMMMFAKGVDDDDWFMKHSANHLAHATLRIKSEMGFYVWPDDFLKLMQSPAASVNTLEKVLDFTKIIDYNAFIDEEKTFLRTYKSGRYEDELYASVWGKGLIPGWRTISDISHSEDKLKFLTE